MPNMAPPTTTALGYPDNDPDYSVSVTLRVTDQTTEPASERALEGTISLWKITVMRGREEVGAAVAVMAEGEDQYTEAARELFGRSFEVTTDAPAGINTKDELNTFFLLPYGDATENAQTLYDRAVSFVDRQLSRENARIGLIWRQGKPAQDTEIDQFVNQWLDTLSRASGVHPLPSSMTKILYRVAIEAHSPDAVKSNAGLALEIAAGRKAAHHLTAILESLGGKDKISTVGRAELYLEMVRLFANISNDSSGSKAGLPSDLLS